METERALQQLELLQKKLYAYHCADSSLYLDAVTTAPSGTAEGRGVAMSILAGESQKLMTCPETKALLDELSARADELDLVHRREVEELRRSCEQLTRIPAEEYMAYKELCNRADDVWHKAKAQDDFALFCPVLQELVDYNRRFAGYYDASKAPYDALLNEYERGVDMEKLDRFFETLRDMGQLSPWFPEVEALIGVPQDPGFHQEGDVWNHTMLVLDQAAALRSRARRPFAFMLAALTHDLGKTVTTQRVRGRIHAYAHETAGVPLVEALLRRIVGEKAVTAYVLNMVELHMKPNALVGADASVKASNRMFDRSVEPEDLILLAAADGRGTRGRWPWEDTEPWLRQRLALYREIMARPQVTGAELIAAGLTPDSRFRELLDYAHKLHLAGIPHDSALKQTLAYARKRK